jgi:hypothetical protein
MSAVMESISNFSQQATTVTSLEESQNSSLNHDLEKKGDYAHLHNSLVRSFAWENVSVLVSDRTSKKSRAILERSNGLIRAGEIMAIMGPR